MTAEGEVGNTAAIHYLLKCASASSAVVSGLRAGHAQLRHAGQPGSRCLSPLRQLLLLPLSQLLLLLHVQHVTHVVGRCRHHGCRRGWVQAWRWHVAGQR